ncbi:MAG: Type secretion system protein [Candidatus Hydrogenedentes bacterium]|nr:Type secretion system protein [Candidatus Hydrogenedentota bacterium]
MRRASGFSLVELLVVVAIIGILMSMYAATLSKARDKAVQVAVGEGMRQDHLGKMADHVNMARPPAEKLEGASREACRAAFRQQVRIAEFDALMTEMKYRVQNDDEFRAYWYTLINPAVTEPLEFAPNGDLIAKDETGRRYALQPLGTIGVGAMPSGNYPVSWEFLSVDLGDTTMSGLGVNVIFNDGHREYLVYPDRFPCTPTVATLTREYVLATQPPAPQ